MQVVAKMPRIDVKMDGVGVEEVISIIKASIPNVVITEDEPQDIDGWGYYHEMKARLTPAKILKIRRENAGLSQAALSERSGIASSNIAMMETGKRNIGARSAKKLAAALGCGAGDFMI